MIPPLPAPATTPPLDEVLAAARDTRRLETGRHILHKFPELFLDVCPGRRAVLVADTNTWKAAGHQVQQALEQEGVPTETPFVFNDPGLYAEYRFVEALENSLRGHDAVPVAVGSGTLNDLSKLAAHLVNRPSLCVATAASMDGYTAYGSSITWQGSKRTFDCPAPVAVLADLEVIGAAPPAMNAWGYADLASKITAGADWILADALGEELIDARSWNTVQAGLRHALADPAGVRKSDPSALACLVEGLMLGGFAMQSSLSSRPASGAEHQFSHLWDMQHHIHEGRAPSHGVKVGIGTLAVTALYEDLLALPLHELDIDRCLANWPTPEQWNRRIERRFTDPALRAVALREMEAKACDADTLRRQLQTLCDHWPVLRGRLRAQLLPIATLRRHLDEVGAATEPEQIGISRERLRETFWSAFFIRRRFTVLDFAARAGLLDECLDRLFSRQGPLASAST